jgi:NADP-dependent 3-hydroxy acid dehydrogenase YdfG
LGARRKDRLDALAKQIRDRGGKAETFVTDVTRRGDVESLVQGAVQAFGRIDVLVNNAGVMPLSPLDRLKVDEWDRMVDVNIKGVLYGIAAALPRMLKQKSGHIINVSSVAGHVLFPTAAVYCGTKFAVRAITEGLRREAKPHVRTTIISPGAVESELANTITDAETAKMVQGLRNLAIPAEAIARAVAYAISEPSDVDVNEMLVRPTAQEL